MNVRATMLHGNCLEKMRLIAPHSVDMILCDLPYGQTRNKWDAVIPFDTLWREYNRVIKPDGAIVLFGSGMFTANLMSSNPDHWRYNLIWEKSSPTGFLNAKRMPLRAHEDICVFYASPPAYTPVMSSGPRKVSTAQHKRGSRHGDSYGAYQAVTYDSDQRYPRSVLHFATDKQKCALHPTQKPVALCEYLIRLYTKETDCVLDNCMGSGSTGVACLNLNRCFIGIELDGGYYDIAVNRLKTIAAQRYSTKSM